MTGYVLSPAARRDLSEIWDSSARNWGADRADRSVMAIRDACAGLADGSRQGRAADDIRPGYRKQPAGSHLIFCRAAERRIEVIRILHRRRDVSSQLCRIAPESAALAGEPPCAHAQHRPDIPEEVA
jgi:toxin ParE1/3/4